jgi:hypothetical protein
MKKVFLNIATDTNEANINLTYIFLSQNFLYRIFLMERLFLLKTGINALIVICVEMLLAGSRSEQLADRI